MATPTIVVLVVVAVATIVIVVTLVLVLVRRLVALAKDLEDLERRLMPTLEQLQRDADVTGREVERVSAALESLDRPGGRRR